MRDGSCDTLNAIGECALDEATPLQCQSKAQARNASQFDQAPDFTLAMKADVSWCFEEVVFESQVESDQKGQCDNREILEARSVTNEEAPCSVRYTRGSPFESS